MTHDHVEDQEQVGHSPVKVSVPVVACADIGQPSVMLIWPYRLEFH